MKKLIGIVAAMFVASLMVVTTVGCGGPATTKTTVKETKGTAGEKTGETKTEEKK